MRIKREATQFNPISVVLETRDDVNRFIDTLDHAMNSAMGQDLYDFIQGLRSAVSITLSAPAQIDVKTDEEVKYPR